MVRYLLHWSYKLAHDVDWCHWLPKQDNSCERKETQDCFLIWIITAQLLVVLAMRYVCAFWSKEHTHGCYVVYRDPWNLFAQQKKWSAAVLSSFPFPSVSVVGKLHKIRCCEMLIECLGVLKAIKLNEDNSYLRLNVCRNFSHYKFATQLTSRNTNLQRCIRWSHTIT